MRFKLLFVVFSFISTMAMAQSQVPPGVNASRYTYCMNEGLGKGRPYATPQAFCRQWAAEPSARAEGMGGQVECGSNVLTGQMYYCSPTMLEGMLRAQRQQALILHQKYLAYQRCMQTLNWPPGDQGEKEQQCQYDSGWPY
jgi:hypothetical protein